MQWLEPDVAFTPPHQLWADKQTIGPMQTGLKQTPNDQWPDWKNHGFLRLNSNNIHINSFDTYATVMTIAYSWMQITFLLMRRKCAFSFSTSYQKKARVVSLQPINWEKSRMFKNKGLDCIYSNRFSERRAYQSRPICGEQKKSQKIFAFLESF